MPSMLASFSFRLAVAALAAVLPAEEGDAIGEALERLIAQTNELASFHVSYSMQASGEGDDEQATLELVYDGPDLARFRMTSDRGGMDLWLFEDGVFLRGQDEEWGRAELPELAPSQVLLDELFPLPERPLGPGPLFVIELNDREEGRTSRFDVSIAYSDSDRLCLLGWLRRMRSPETDVTREGDELIWSGDTYRMHVSTEHGFPTRIDLQGESRAMRLDLLTCRLDEPLEEQLVELPGAAFTAELNPQIAAHMASIQSLAQRRRNGFERVHYLLNQDDLEWGAGAARDWTRFLEEVHRDGLARVSRERLEHIDTQLDGFVGWIQDQRARDGSADRLLALQQRVAEAREDMDGSFDRFLGDCLGQLPEIDLAGEALDEVFELERQVLTELVDELQRAPGLAAFDARMEAALGL